MSKTIALIVVIAALIIVAGLWYFVSKAKGPSEVDVRILEAYLSKPSVNEGEPTNLFVRVKNFDRIIATDVFVATQLDKRDEEFINFDTRQINLGNLKSSEEQLKSFEITARLPAGDSIKYDIELSVFVNNTEVGQPKSVSLTVRR